MITCMELQNEIDMLQGNINRMCVTADEKELSRMKAFAKHRIDEIFDFRLSLIFKKCYNKGNDCDCCENQYLCGIDGDCTSCKCNDNGEPCNFIERKGE